MAPIHYIHDIVSNDHLVLWIEVHMAEGERTHYLRLVDKDENIEHEIKMDDAELDRVIAEMATYRRAMP